MTKFFRNIRQRLLSENKVGKYLIYATGEILIILIGVLIAIQINNWNEHRKEEQVKKSYLNQLLLDFETDKTYYSSIISRIEKGEDRYKKYLDLYAIPNIDATTFLSEMLKGIDVNTFEITFSTTTIITLISTGDIKIMPESIGSKLVNYNASQNTIKSNHSINVKGSNDILVGISLLLNDQLLIRLQNQPQLSKFLDVEKSLPKIIVGYDSFLFWRDGGDKIMLVAFNKLMNEADTIIEIINQELEK